MIYSAKEDLTQADLRRAVSSAYYAVFHLLIADATGNWKRESSRAAFGRLFEHSVMRRASQRLADPKLFPFHGHDASVVHDLRLIAKIFVQLQDKRHLADYHNGLHWTHVQAMQDVSEARKAFEIWATIRNEDIAQEYLVSLLIRPRD